MPASDRHVGSKFPTRPAARSRPDRPFRPAVRHEVRRARRTNARRFPAGAIPAPRGAAGRPCGSLGASCTGHQALGATRPRADPAGHDDRLTLLVHNDRFAAVPGSRTIGGRIGNRAENTCRPGGQQNKRMFRAAATWTISAQRPMPTVVRNTGHPAANPTASEKEGFAAVLHPARDVGRTCIIARIVPSGANDQHMAIGRRPSGSIPVKAATARSVRDARAARIGPLP